MRGRRLRVLLATGVLAVLVALALSACGGGSQEANKKSESGGSADKNGQIAFRRYFNPDQTKGAIFTMNPDGSHIRQITHPPQGLAPGRWASVVSRWAEDRLPSRDHRP